MWVKGDTLWLRRVSIKRMRLPSAAQISSAMLSYSMFIHGPVGLLVVMLTGRRSAGVVWRGTGVVSMRDGAECQAPMGWIHPLALGEGSCRCRSAP